MFFTAETIKRAIRDLRGGANHLLKIWFVLKAMGLDEEMSVAIDTSNSTPYLKKLFSCGAPDGSFFVPFAHTLRFASMKSDAARSIIQTTLKRWATSGSVVTCDPSSFMKIENATDNKLIVRTGRQYPLGLGNGKNGFAIEDNKRITIPDLQFAVWIFAQQNIENENDSAIIDKMIQILHISNAEAKLIFIKKNMELSFQDQPITNEELYNICQHAFDEDLVVEEQIETTTDYIRRVKNMITVSDKPIWTQIDPTVQLKQLLDQGDKAILLYGPPRTGKTRAIDAACSRCDADRTTIQLHEGWGYENLVIGFFPTKEAGLFDWEEGALLRAIRSGKKFIVLEEINRTNVSQVLGEVFSLIESTYRGRDYAIELPNGKSIYIPEETAIIFTMNTIDSSTEDVDDALIGRMSSVYFPPRIEDLDIILTNNGIDEVNAEKIKEIFNDIQAQYPLGHGYFANYRAGQDFKMYYLTRIRPVLSNHFETFRPEIISQIDNAVDALFNIGE